MRARTQVEVNRMARSRLRDRGQVTLPSDVREALQVEEGDDIEFEITPNGVMMRGLKLIPAAQAWFWTATWQAGEREAEEQLQSGQGEIFKTSDDFLDSLG